MVEKHRLYKTGFDTTSIEIECGDAVTFDLAAFLFSDLPGTCKTSTPFRLQIKSTGTPPIFSLYKEQRELYRGSSLYNIAYSLMNEVIFSCIEDHSAHHALHAGCVSKDDYCLLLPGSSGDGKSSLTAWLVTEGFSYLTDELVFLSSSGKAFPFTRPVNLKKKFEDIHWLELGEKQDSISDKHGSMIPHRQLNPNFHQATPTVTHIIFPHYQENTVAALKELSPGKSAFNLLQSFVNARNLENHGINSLSKIVRKCRSYELWYKNTVELPELLDKLEL